MLLNLSPKWLWAIYGLFLWNVVLVKLAHFSVGILFPRCSKTGSEHPKEHLAHGELEKMAWLVLTCLVWNDAASTAPETRANFFSKSKFWPSMGQVEVQPLLGAFTLSSSVWDPGDLTFSPERRRGHICWLCLLETQDSLSLGLPGWC